MGGKDYFVCRLLIKSGKLVMPAGATIRVFFDTPENCGLTAGAVRFELTANATLTATGFNPNTGNYDVPGFYLLGSPTIPTNVNLSGGGGATNEFILYAPNVDVDMGGNSKWIGMMAGKTLTLHGDSTFESNPNIKLPEIGIRKPVRTHPLLRVHGGHRVTARRELLIPARRSSSGPILPS